MFSPNREELAWAAGFFDGEGSMSAPARKWTERRYPFLHMPQIDPYVLHRFQAAVGGVGHVRDREPAHGKKQRQWDFYAQAFEEVQAIVAMLWAFLSPVKREQATRVLTMCHHELVRYSRPGRRGHLRRQAIA